MPALLSYSGPSFPADAQKRVGRCSVVDFWPDILTAGGATGRQENGKTSGDQSTDWPVDKPFIDHLSEV